VEGQLLALKAPIVLHDLSRDGFAVISPVPFPAGAHLDFRLTAAEGQSVTVTAEAVHSRPVPGSSELHLSGFRFVPGRVTGLLPQAQIDRLIAAVTPQTSCFA
jgi:hypothetical protein